MARLIVLFVVLWAAVLTQTPQTELGKLAASMKPGEWKSFSPTGWNGSGILQPTAPSCATNVSDYITQYADSAAWAKGKISFLGQAHGNCYAGEFVQFDETTNAFTRGPWPSEMCKQVLPGGVGCFSHAYDHNTADPATGDVYYRAMGNAGMFRFRNGAWAKIANYPPAGSSNCCGAFKWVPNFGLVLVDGDWGVWKLDPATLAWTLLAQTNPLAANPIPGIPVLGALCGTCVWGEYSSAKQMLLFGSSNIVWGMNVAGQFTKLADAPTILANNISIQTVDPATGHLLALSGALMYQLDITANVWSPVTTTIPFPNPGDGAVEVSVPEHGVIMFLKYYVGQNNPVWLYRHLPSNEPPIPPVKPPPMPSPRPPADWITRSNAAGVVLAVGFDLASDIAGSHGASSGLFPGASNSATLDTSVKASGLSSLKFTIPPKSGSDSSGAYFTNFSSDLSVQFGSGETFYYQWRQRISPELLNTNFTNGGGWKHSIAGTGDRQGGPLASSCTYLEVVVQNTNQIGVPQMYNSCYGSTSHGAYDPFIDFIQGGAWKLQNAMPSPFCLNTGGPSYAGCFKYTADEWMTFQVAVYIGTRTGNEFINSWVRLWVAREGQPSQLVINHGPYALSGGIDQDKFGKLWLLPYHTGKDPNQIHPTAYTWYDELIVSRNFIADPQHSGTPPPVDTQRPIVE